MTGFAVSDRAGARRLRRFSAPTLSRGLWVTLWAAGVALVAIVVWGTVLGRDEVPGDRVAFRLVGAAFITCGLIAWRRRPDSQSGLLMTATGFLLFIEPLLALWDSPATETLTILFSDLWAVTIVWLLLTLLSGGHVTTRTEWVLIGVFAIEPLLELAWSVTDSEVFETLRALTVSVACLAVAGVIAARFARASPPGRRALLPSVAGISSLLLFAFAQQAPPAWLRWLAILSLLTIPAGFLVGLLRSRLARGGLADLFRELPTLRADELQPALARAVGDPSLVVAHGRAEVGEGRAVARINDDAVLIYDAGLDEDPELIEAATAAAAIALESRARLERIVTAGDEERRRLERDLHDGAQQRLVALAMQLRLVQHEIQADPEAAHRLINSASDELALSLAELRELARGIHPAVLNHGLEPALQALAGQATVPTDVAYSAEGELPERVELAAYFVTSEALANVGKYARASSASIRVSRGDGGIVLQIADDGVGGADASRGSGLRGLADRVEALDGRLRVESPPGAGTVVTAELPCGS